MLARLAHVRNWIFDLDNTLYPASARLFDQIDAKMTAYIAERLEVDHAEAHRIHPRVRGRGRFYLGSSRRRAAARAASRQQGDEAQRPEA